MKMVNLSKHANQGFTLIELSIVLVIIALLVGGVLVGKDLIRNQINRTVIAEVEGMNTAITTFKGKYNCLPGDCANATQFFGADPGGCSVITKSAVTSGTCNGNGNGGIGQVSSAWNQEPFRAMEQLNLAGLMGGKTLTGAGYTSQGNMDNTMNVPPSRAYSQAGYLLQSQEGMGQANYCSASGGGCWYWQAIPRSNVIYMSGSNIHSGHSGTVEGMYGLDAYNIDVKIDDGKPAFGKMVTSLNAIGCMTTTVEATAEYNKASTTAGCANLVFATSY